MEEKYIDESGDKKYFTMIPNYIVNHSTAYEQSLYLVMKRITGEEGSCWATPIKLGQIMGVSANTVKKYRDKLIKRGWIKKIGQRKTGTTGQIVSEYKIIDLWQFNMKHYNKVSNNDTLKVSSVDAKVSPNDSKVSPVAYKEEPIKNNHKEKPYSPKSLELAKLLYKLIKDNNPSWYVKPNWDKWAEDIDKIIRLDNRTAEQVEWMIIWVQADSFWKQNILSPIKLREKFNDLVVRAKQNKKGGITII